MDANPQFMRAFDQLRGRQADTRRIARNDQVFLGADRIGIISDPGQAFRADHIGETRKAAMIRPVTGHTIGTDQLHERKNRPLP